MGASEWVKKRDQKEECRGLTIIRMGIGHLYCNKYIVTKEIQGIELVIV